MAVEIQTARLLLRPYQPADIDALHQLWTGPAVRKYLWDDQIIPHETAQEAVTCSIADWAAYCYGQWTVCMSENKELIGFCGFRSGEAVKEPELLYGLAFSHWGRGFATEASHAALRYGFERLRVKRIWAATDPPNVASVRAMERLGMQFDRRDTLNGLDSLFYSISREQFSATDEIFVVTTV